MGVLPGAHVGAQFASSRRCWQTVRAAGPKMATRHLLRRIVIGCLLFVGASERTPGQTTGRITGIVRDGSGGTVSSAEVKAINETTGEKWKAVTDDTGNYSFLLLPPGLYQ